MSRLLLAICEQAGAQLSCVYPLNADGTEIALIGGLPFTMSNSDRTATYSVEGTPASAKNVYALTSGFTSGPPTLDLTGGPKVIEFNGVQFPAPVAAGAGAYSYTLQLRIGNETLTGFYAETLFFGRPSGQIDAQIKVARSTVATLTNIAAPAVVGFEFDNGTARVYFDNVPQSLSADTYTPGLAVPFIYVQEPTTCDDGNAGKTLAATVATKAEDITGTYTAGATDPCGDAV